MSDFPSLLASELGISRRHVMRKCVAGEIPGAYRTKGGHWRLRKPRSRASLANCDRRIAEFILRYFSDGGYFSPWTAEQEANLNQGLIDLASQGKLDKLPPSVRRSVVGRLQAHVAEEMERLTASDEFNAALEFSTVAYGIADSDLPANRRDYKAWLSFKEREPEKFRLLIETPLADMIHPRAWDAIKKLHSRLHVKAEKLRLNQRDVTPDALAGELGISVATLYRDYGRDLVRRVCRPAAMYPEMPEAFRHRL